MSISQSAYKRAIVAAISQIVTVGTAFSPAELENAFALIGMPGNGATGDQFNAAVIRLFFHRASGTTSVAPLLDALAGTATSAHVLTKQPGGLYLVATV